MTVSFDKKLAELDAYLQMLIEQNELLDKKIDITNVDAEKEGLILIKNNLESLLGDIKHAIVKLQIAKVSIKTSEIPTTPPRPLSSRIVGRPSPGSSIKALQTKLATTTTTTTSAASQKANANSNNINININSSSSSNSNSKPLSANGSCDSGSSISSNSSSTAAAIAASLQEQQRQLADPLGYGVPNRSNGNSHTNYYHYNNDDDDDAFYDAADETPKPPVVSGADLHIKLSDINSQEEASDIEGEPNSISGVPKTTDLTMSTNSNNNNNNSSSLGLIEDVSIDWDSLYDEEEEDLGSLENQGSVIKHLMSQIRIGMDLTKVVLPTFILERRSLLEMYADFFAHPDLFSSIPDYETPEERMVQIVRWYLSAFHAGRKSAVAKKPYNPILGEIFLCHWNLDSQITAGGASVNNNNNSNEENEPKLQIERTQSTESTTSISDIEKFTKQLPKNSLMFVAEQVSHHPPVSAFYAENPEKQISCCAHIYTKSKYLGLSVGVHNLGQGVINVLKHNETYVCTFPSAYGRSILTVPWVELGGTVKIACEQTGYSANIEFLTKPFYGGKKHRVVAEILRPNKEPFMTIDGEWNGCVYHKTSPISSQDKQMFVDTTNLPVIKKNVRSISSQESYESRNVWKEVTRALKLHDVASATTAKSFIEQRQRDLLKDRMEKGVSWKTRFFETVDDGWTYVKLLADKPPVSGSEQ